MPEGGKHNSSNKSALTQPGVDGLKQIPMTGKDVLVYPKPDGSKPIPSGFDMENSPAGT